MRCLSVVALLLLPTLVLAQPPKEVRPQVLLLGDSIRLGYAPIVTKKLEGVAEVFSFPENGGDSASTLKQLEAWAHEEKLSLRAPPVPLPALIVHFNCGLHDLKFGKKT